MRAPHWGSPQSVNFMILSKIQHQTSNIGFARYNSHHAHVKKDTGIGFTGPVP